MVEKKEIHIYHHYPWTPNYYPYVWHGIIPPYTQTFYPNWVYRPQTTTGGTSTGRINRYDSI